MDIEGFVSFINGERVAAIRMWSLMSGLDWHKCFMGSSLSVVGSNCSSFLSALTTSYVPVSKRGYWQIEMDDVHLSGGSVTSTKSAIVDSGTSLLTGPSEDVKMIASQVVRASPSTTCTSNMRDGLRIYLLRVYMS